MRRPAGRRTWTADWTSAASIRRPASCCRVLPSTVLIPRPAASRSSTMPTPCRARAAISCRATPSTCTCRNPSLTASRWSVTTATRIYSPPRACLTMPGRTVPIGSSARNPRWRPAAAAARGIWSTAGCWRSTTRRFTATAGRASTGQANWKTAPTGCLPCRGQTAGRLGRSPLACGSARCYEPVICCSSPVLPRRVVNNRAYRGILTRGCCWRSRPATAASGAKCR